MAVLRRLRAFFARIFARQTPEERLGRLLATLRANGVTRYEVEGLKLRLEPVRPAAEAPAMPPVKQPSDQELLFGEPEDELRRQGLI